MTKQAYDQAFWQRLWTRTLREHGEKVANRPHSPYVEMAVDGLAVGKALDAGCGHGGEALWLAQRGWHVTGVDFSAAALRRANQTAMTLGPDVVERTTWVQADLGQWVAQPRAYDFVLSLYVHVAGEVELMVQRLADGVAIGGRLLLVGHQAVDPATGEATRAAGQVQVGREAVMSALDVGADGCPWQVVIAEVRRRAHGGGVDEVVLLQRVAG